MNFQQYTKPAILALIVVFVGLVAMKVMPSSPVEDELVANVNSAPTKKIRFNTLT